MKKIRTRLKLNIWISLGVVMLIIFSFVWSFREMHRHEQNKNLAGEMHQSTFERNSWGRGIFLITFFILGGGIAIIANSIIINRIAAKRMAVLKKEIIEHKRMEKDLQISEMRFRTIMDQAVDMILVHDIKGRFVDANREACKNLGYTKEELLRLSVVDINPMAIADGKDAFWNMVVEGQRFTFESRYRRKDGASYPVEISIGPIVLGEETLIIGLVRNITERKRAEEELRTSRQQLQAFAARLQQVREEFRIMISREIHDELGGGLTGLKMDLAWLLRKAYDVKAGKERTALMDKIHTSTKLIDQMIQVSRRIATDLRPSVLDDLGLIAALEWQSDEFESRTGIPVEFTTDFDYVTLEQDTVTAVFRIFQEALTNVARHSGATKVTVLLREEAGSFILEIRDNGRGITEGEILDTKSFGLLGMKERVLIFGGELWISGEPDSGTALILIIPQKQGEAT